jgi:hypothetical protein
MARDTEIVKAASESEAIEIIASLYPTLIDYEILSRRNERGHFSRWGHTFVIAVRFEEPEDEAPEELGEDEY